MEQIAETSTIPIDQPSSIPSDHRPPSKPSDKVEVKCTNLPSNNNTGPFPPPARLLKSSFPCPYPYPYPYP